MEEGARFLLKRKLSFVLKLLKDLSRTSGKDGETETSCVLCTD